MATTARRPAARAAAPARATGARSAARTTRNDESSALYHRGAEARARAETERQEMEARAKARREQGHQPFRFRIPPGETTQFIVVDDAADFFMYEHNLKNPKTKKFDLNVPCIKEIDNCPACEGDKDSYYGMFLTVIDLTQYEANNGDLVDFSRKLLVVKPAQQKKFLRKAKQLEAEGLTLRGALFEVTRDGDMDASIGNDIEYIEHVSEDELATYVREWTDRENKRHTEQCSEPYDYVKLFPVPTAESISALMGGRSGHGNSRAAVDSAIGRRPSRSRQEDDDPDEQDEADAQDDAPPTRSARRGAATARSSRRPSSREEEYQDDDQGEQDDAPPPRRAGQSRQAAAATREPARRPVPGAARYRDQPPLDDDQGEPEDDVGEQDDAPPPRTGRRVVTRGRR